VAFFSFAMPEFSPVSVSIFVVVIAVVALLFGGSTPYRP
jgi:hypothetical protein